MTPSVAEAQIVDALGSFLTSILPAGVSVILGQVNRAAEPEGDFVVMWPLRRPRLATNLSTLADAKFTGSIAGTVMTIDSVEIGQLALRATIFGVGVADGTTVESFGSGSGGVGTYNIAPSQTVPETTLSAGAVLVAQSSEVVYQLDVHGPNSGDNAQVISTLFRDDYAVTEFAGSGVSPLYADDPRQVPFVNAASQFENRWVIEAHMQVVPSVSVPQQFADELSVTTFNVPAQLPPP